MTSPRIKELDTKISEIKKNLLHHEGIQRRHTMSEPKIPTEPVRVGSTVYPNDMSPQEIFDFLTANPDATFVSAGYDTLDDVMLVSSRMETQEEFADRVKVLTAAHDAWANMRQVIADEITKMHQAMADLKAQKNAVYQDAEYIEFLRLQSRLKEKGMI